MDFDLSSEQTELREMVRRFAQQEARPLFERAEESGEFPRDVFRRLAEIGVLCMTVPPEVGGAGATKVTECIVIEELSRVSSSLAAALMIHGGVGISALTMHGSAELRERYLLPAIEGKAISAFALTEPDAGSDAANITTRAVAKDDHYVLDGRKMYITNASIADFMTVAAVTDPDVPPGRGISLFIVPADVPGLEIAPRLKKVGHRAADTAPVYFDSCAVSRDHLIGDENHGFEYIRETLTAGRIAHAARSLGVAEAALALAVEYADDRRAFGKRLFDFQSIAFSLSELATQVDAARLMVYRAAWMLDEGVDCRKEASMAKLYASEVAEQVASRAMHIHGGFGYMEEAPIQRLWRDAKLFPITEGTSEIQKLIISRELRRRSL